MSGDLPVAEPLGMHPLDFQSPLDRYLTAPRSPPAARRERSHPALLVTPLMSPYRPDAATVNPRDFLLSRVSRRHQKDHRIGRPNLVPGHVPVRCDAGYNNHPQLPLLPKNAPAIENACSRFQNGRGQRQCALICHPPFSPNRTDWATQNGTPKAPKISILPPHSSNNRTGWGTHPRNAIFRIFSRLAGVCQEVWNQVEYLKMLGNDELNLP